MMEHYQETLVALSRAIEQNPEDAWAIAHRGETYRLMKRYFAALDDFNRVIKQKPDYVWALAHRGETYSLMKNYEEALADFNQAVERKPENAWNLAHRGVNYHQLKRDHEALSDLTLAIELKPDYSWALIHRCQLYALAKRYEEALVDFDRAIAHNETIINHWQGERGLLLNYLGRYAETISCCEHALQENPNDYTALYSLAVAKACGKGLTEAQANIDKTRAVLQSVVCEEARAGITYRLGSLAALEGRTNLALNYLQQAISLDDEPIELARRDPAWLNLRTDQNFQLLIEKDQDVRQC